MAGEEGSMAVGGGKGRNRIKDEVKRNKVVRDPVGACYACLRLGV